MTAQKMYHLRETCFPQAKKKSLLDILRAGNGEMGLWICMEARHRPNRTAQTAADARTDTQPKRFALGHLR